MQNLVKENKKGIRTTSFEVVLMLLWDHPYITYAKRFKKLAFLTP